MSKFSDIDWEEVEDGNGGGFSELPTGGYVMKVVGVVDEEGRVPRWGGDPYDAIDVVFDVAEGEYADFFAKGKRPDFAHTHEFRWNPAQMTDERDAWRPKQFKSFWSRILPESNDGWEWDMDGAESFKGLLFGATVRHRKYTKGNGEDGDQLQIQGLYPARKIRDGEFRDPEDYDARKPKQEAAPAPVADEADELPF